MWSYHTSRIPWNHMPYPILNSYQFKICKSYYTYIPVSKKTFLFSNLFLCLFFVCVFVYTYWKCSVATHGPTPNVTADVSSESRVAHVHAWHLRVPDFLKIPFLTSQTWLQALNTPHLNLKKGGGVPCPRFCKDVPWHPKTKWAHIQWP